MLMWYIILLVTIIATLSGLLYVGNRVSKFCIFPQKWASTPKRQKLFSFILVLLFFAAVSAWLNLMNAVICLLHFAVIWLVCDFIFYLIKMIRKKTFKRYYAGLAAILLSLIALAAGWHLDHNVWKTAYSIQTEKNIENLHIVYFADSHIGTTFDGQTFEKHTAEMQKQNPDIVFIVGDFVDDGTSRADMIAACQALGKMKTKYGVYFVFGNHDKGYYSPEIRGFDGNDLIVELEKNNVKVLQDEAVLINNMFYVLGRKDLSEFHRGSSRANMQKLTEELDKNKFIIVLDHQPADYKQQANAQVDLVISGHTHGGQLFPLNKVGEWIGANDKTYGYERQKLTDFIVTSGLSDWAIKFKTGTKSEFVVIDIKQ